MGEAVAAAGKGLSIAGKMAEGAQQKAAGQVRAIQLRTAAEAGRVRATQIDASMREDLEGALSNISAIRAAQGVGFDSPTMQAVLDKAEETNRRTRQTAASNERLKALGLEGDAATAWNNSRMAMTTAMLRAAPDALSLGQSLIGAIPKG